MRKICKRAILLLLFFPLTLNAAENNVVLVKGRLSPIEVLNFKIDPNEYPARLSVRERVDVQEVLIGPAGLKQFEVITRMAERPVGELYILARGQPSGPMRAVWINWADFGLCLDDAIARDLGVEEAIRKLRSGKEKCKFQ